MFKPYVIIQKKSDKYGARMKLLIVIDMQNDFIDGVLGTKDAVKIVPKVAAKIREYRESGGTVVFTRDTHQENYLQTQEGKNLPVVHCVEGTAGWQISENLEKIELAGLCTDICVISNALLLKTKLPEVPVCVDSSCCAGVTPESHQNALNAMKMCQIGIL